MFMHQNKGTIAVAFAAIIFLPTCRAQPESVETKNPFSSNPTAIRNGEELFGRNCQQCHNSRGKGGKGPQLLRGAWAPGGANSDLYMYRTIAGGRPGTQMGGFGTSLGADEIWEIVAFLRMEAQSVKASDGKAKPDDDLW